VKYAQEEEKQEIVERRRVLTRPFHGCGTPAKLLMASCSFFGSPPRKGVFRQGKRNTPLTSTPSNTFQTNRPPRTPDRRNAKGNLIFRSASDRIHSYGASTGHPDSLRRDLNASRFGIHLLNINCQLPPYSGSLHQPAMWINAILTRAAFTSFSQSGQM
jgi:hypothetical protein